MSNDYQAPLPEEDWALTAKAAAYRAFALHEVELFASGVGEEPAAKVETLKLIQGIHALKLETPDGEAFFGEVGDHLSSSLKRLFSPDSLALNYFLDSFRSETQKFGSIRDEINSWLTALLTVSNTYFTTADLIRPVLKLKCEIDRDLKLGVSGKTEPNSGNLKEADRHIVLIFNPAAFDHESYFAIPYVLSHEFWCHGLSRWVRVQGPAADGWTGCSPLDSWEEGWMDYVQFQILKNQVTQVLPNPASLESLMVRYGNLYAVERYAGDELILRGNGYQAADSFHRFLNCREKYLGIDLTSSSADELFTLLSLDLNSIECDAKIKQSFVKWVWAFLNPSQSEHWRRSDASLVAQRTALQQILADNINESLVKPKRLNVLKLLSLCGQLD
jgi:hypothetical protein